MKITFTKRVELNGKVLDRQITLEIPDNQAHRIDIEEAMFRVLTRGAWLAPVVPESTPLRSNY